MEASRGQLSLARSSVDVFFILSGFLLARSCERSSLLEFARNRFLRIFPGLWVCLILTGLLAPVVIYGLAPGWNYVLLTAPLFWPLSAPSAIPGLFTDNRFIWVNSALWTLRWEVWCYASLPIAMWIIARAKWAAILILAALWAVFSFNILAPVSETAAVTSPFRLFTFFYAGVAAYSFRDSIPIRGTLFALSFGLLAAGTALGALYLPISMGVFYLIAPVALTYFVLYLAARLPLRRLNTKTDLSYGVYIYGSFVLQVAVSFGVRAPAVPYWPMVFGVMAVTLILAWLSWTLVEKPAMGLRNAKLFRTMSASNSQV